MKASQAITLSALLLVTLGQKPISSVEQDLEPQLQRLKQAGRAYHFVCDQTIEVSDPLRGWKQTKTLREPDETTIRNWASTRGISVIDIDPTLVDTSKWTGWYNYWTNVPVANDVRIPTQVRDFDGNGLPEVYGNFGGVGFPQTRCYEVYQDGSSALRHTYPSTTGFSTHILDIDRNGLVDVAFAFGQLTYVYEQPTPSSLPTELMFVFSAYDGLARYLSIEHMVDMDGDSVIDFVHRGADTSVAQGNMLCVSEYNPSVQNFRRVWYIVPPRNEFDGYDVGDYDDDVQMEILASSLWGKVWVIENTGNNAYALIFQDSLVLVNLFYQSSGDVDNDGKREFFVGATMGSGNWTVMYEADGDNHYTPRIVLHLLSGGSLDDPPYFTEDVDRDGIVELVILSGGYLYIFKSDTNDSYYLWFLKQGPGSFSINFHDMDGDGIKDILWTAIRNNSWVSDIYKGSPLMGVGPEQQGLPERAELLQNYPNPFNPITKIVYKVKSREFVSLKVYDMLGREVQTLVNEAKTPGEYQVTWDARGFASGIYIYRLQTTAAGISKKMLLVR